jgi:tetratricopeptide (TPR) repeat protein
MELMSVLSPAGTPRTLLYAASQGAALRGSGQTGAITPGAVDEALGRLAGSSLLTFSMNGAMVAAHRLVMRIIREQLASQGQLTAVGQAAATVLRALSEPVRRAREDRLGRRDLIEQILAVAEATAPFPTEADSQLTRDILALRGLAVTFLNDLGDRADQAIRTAETLLADQQQVLGPDDADVLNSRNNLGNAYRAAGRPDQAIVLHEHALVGRERILGPDHLDTMSSRNNLGNAYRAAGRTAEAIARYEETLDGRERVFGSDHPGVQRFRIGLAAIRAS